MSWDLQAGSLKQGDVGSRQTFAPGEKPGFIITMTSHGSYFAMAIKPGVRYTEKFRNVGETRAMMLENLSLFTCRLTSFISQECFSIYSKIFSRFLRGNLYLLATIISLTFWYLILVRHLVYCLFVKILSYAIKQKL